MLNDTLWGNLRLCVCVCVQKVYGFFYTHTHCRTVSERAMFTMTGESVLSPCKGCPFLVSLQIEGPLRLLHTVVTPIEMILGTWQGKLWVDLLDLCSMMRCLVPYSSHQVLYVESCWTEERTSGFTKTHKNVVTDSGTLSSVCPPTSMSCPCLWSHLVMSLWTVLGSRVCEHIWLVSIKSNVFVESLLWISFSLIHYGLIVTLTHFFYCVASRD